MIRKNLLDKWSYEDIMIRKATLNDVERLQEICYSWDEKETLEGYNFSEDYIEHSITHGDLPPIDRATKEQQAFMVIENTQHDIIGFFDCYQGYPDADCLWIGMFMIDKTYQHKQYGSQAIQSILQQGKALTGNEVAWACI